MRKQFFTITCASIAALSLAACEFRRESGEEPPPAVSETPDLSATGESEEPQPDVSETPGISIIREDVRADVVAEAPAEPFAITVPFPDGGKDIDPAAQRALLEVLQSDALDEGWPLVLRGHTDSMGNDSANLRASRARAEAVAAWLVERGVDDDRITAIAFGEQNPVAPNALPDGEPNEDGRALNRRVEIDIAPPLPANASAAATPIADNDEDA